jgi:hypothetical protein
MLFDLRGKRRRFIQVVYALLAVLFFVSFVGFGIGSDVSGGIFDALGIGGGDSASSSNPQFDEDIEDAEQKLEQNPKDERALLSLATTHFAAGKSAVDQDPETGAEVPTEESREEYTAATEAWERYLDTKPKKPNSWTALQLVGAYLSLAQSDTDPTELQVHLEGGRETARIAAEAQPSANTYFTLAQFAYLSGDTKLGDQAADRVLAESSGAEAKNAEKLLTSFEKSGEELQKQIKQQSAGKEELEAPLGGLGGSQPAPAPAP